MMGIEGAAIGFGLLLLLLFFGLHIASALFAVAALGPWWVFGDAMTLLILAAAFCLNFVIGVMGVPAQVSAFVSGFDLSPLVMVLLLELLYLLPGCFLDALAMMIATMPIVRSNMRLLGYASVWFGIFLMLMCGMALITPPVGIDLFVVQSVRGRGLIARVIVGVLPFLGCILLLVALIALFPGIVGRLPGLSAG